MQLTPGFPDRLVLDVGKVFDGFQSWVIDNHATSPLFIYFLNPIKDTANTLLDAATNILNRMTYAGRDRRRRRRWPGSSPAGGCRSWPPLGFSVMGLLGLWTSSMETLALIIVSVRHGAADRHPARHLGRAQRSGREGPPPGPRCDADGAGVRVPAAARAAVRHRRRHRHHLDADLRAAAGRATDQPRHPRRAVHRPRGLGLVRLDPDAESAQGAAADGEALDHARRQPDHHDGDGHGRDRGDRGRARPRTRRARGR